MRWCGVNAATVTRPSPYLDRKEGQRLPAVVTSAGRAAGRQLVADAFAAGAPERADVERLATEVMNRFGDALVAGMEHELKRRGF